MWRPGDPSSLLANQSVEIASSGFIKRTCLKDKMGTVKMHNIYLCLHSAHTSELQHTHAHVLMRTHTYTRVHIYMHSHMHTGRKERRKEGGKKERRKETKKGKRKGNPYGFLGLLPNVFNKAKVEGAGEYDMFPDEADADVMLSSDSARRGGRL